MPIPMVIPVRRGCGVRVEGGIYIVTHASIEELADYIDMSDADVEGKLYIFPKPWPTLVPLKPFRGFRGFDKWRFFRDIDLADKTQLRKVLHLDVKIAELGKKRIRLKNCYYAHPEKEDDCDRSWLHWIGNQYYTIESFIDEARVIGVSRRVPEKILQKMKWGDAIFLASKEKHLKSPVIFGYFKLEGIQGIKVKLNDMPKHLQDEMKFENVDY